MKKNGVRQPTYKYGKPLIGLYIYEQRSAERFTAFAAYGDPNDEDALLGVSTYVVSKASAERLVRVAKAEEARGNGEYREPSIVNGEPTFGWRKFKAEDCK